MKPSPSTQIQSQANGLKMKTQLCRHFERIKQMFARERLLNSRTEHKDRHKIAKTADFHDLSFKRYADISSHEIRERTMEANSAELDVLLFKSKSLNVKKLNVIFQFSGVSKLMNKKHTFLHKNRKSKQFLRSDHAVPDGTKSQFFKKLKKEYSPQPSIQRLNRIKAQVQLEQNIVFNKSLVLNENMGKNIIKPNIQRRQYYRQNIKQLKRDQNLLDNFHKILQQKSMEVRTPSTLGPWKQTPKQNPEF